MSRGELMDDLAYVRTLAEEGRSAPLLGGAHFVAWGLLVSAAWMGHYWVITNYAQTELGQPLGLLWGGFGVVAGLMSVILHRRMRGKPGLSSGGNRAERAIWEGIGMALFAIAVGSIVRMAVFKDFDAPNTILPAAVALYGAGMIATARFSNETILRVSGVAAVILGLGLQVIANEPYVYLLGSAGALIVLVIPGILLLRREPSAVV